MGNSQRTKSEEKKKKLPNFDFQSGNYNAVKLYIQNHIKKWENYKLDSKEINEFYNDLERDHSFIQWIFPNFFASMFNAMSYRLTLEERNQILQDEKAQKNYMRNYHMFLRFLGIKYINDELELENERQLKQCVFTNTHNLMRIQRIFASLSVLGRRQEALKLLDFFKNYEKHNSRFNYRQFSQFEQTQEELKENFNINQKDIQNKMEVEQKKVEIVQQQSKIQEIKIQEKDESKTNEDELKEQKEDKESQKSEQDKNSQSDHTEQLSSNQQSQQIQEEMSQEDSKVNKLEQQIQQQNEKDDDGFEEIIHLKIKEENESQQMKVQKQKESDNDDDDDDQIKDLFWKEKQQEKQQVIQQEKQQEEQQKKKQEVKQSDKETYNLKNTNQKYQDRQQNPPKRIIEFDDVKNYYVQRDLLNEKWVRAKLLSNQLIKHP